ncbi:DUF4190 domain-containing protein [Leifsonia sp. SIMBA_070]|uniref:DUF4190 domain-containing protein n=1 Tax=Leifsonia sp. SIMBA_070 TaxID=3085810 RepID=UPI00397D9EFC
MPLPVETTPASTSTSSSTNPLAIVSFVLAFVLTVPAIVCGHVALRQISRTGEQGRGLALAGTILGYAFTLPFAVMVIGIVPALILSAMDAVNF